MTKRKDKPVEEGVVEEVKIEPKLVVELKSDSKGKYYEKLFRGGK